MGAPLQPRDGKTRNVGLTRVLTELRLLRRQSLTVRELANTLRVTRRTIWRDLQVLKRAGVRVRGRQETSTSETRFYLPEVW